MNRRQAFELFGRLGLARLVLRVRRSLPPMWLTVLAYHRIGERDPHSPWDGDLVSAAPETFRQQLAFVKRYFSPITSEQLILWKKGRFAMPRNPIVLTFDDGYLDNYRVALPLLLEVGVVADFFICPWNIENRRLFWWDKIAYCLRKTRRESITLTYPESIRLELATEESMQTARRTVLRIVKHTPKLDIQALVDELQQRTEVNFDEQGEAEKLLMGWDHVRSLRRAGMGVGSHSYSHPILPLADDETARREMLRSRLAIEKELNERVSALAYPVGCFSNGTNALARQEGYEIAYSYCSGASFLRSADLFEVRRVAVESYMSLAYFQTMVAAPFFA